MAFCSRLVFLALVLDGKTMRLSGPVSVVHDRQSWQQWSCVDNADGSPPVQERASHVHQQQQLLIGLPVVDQAAKARIYILSHHVF